MKKLSIVSTATLLLFTAALNAQTDSVQKEAVPAEKQVSGDKYNNWSADTYKMLPMPEALTTEKVFPVIGNYQVTDKSGNAMTVSVELDAENRGIIYVNGLPQGKLKAILRKSPATYKIPAQKSGDDKDVAEGVLIYDRDANVLNVCIGCKYNNEDPAVAFNEETPADEAVESKTKTAKTSRKSTAKVAKVKSVHYSGNKVIETTASAEVK